MLGRVPLRDPFIFLTSFLNDGEDITFSGSDYIEVVNRLYQYQIDYAANDRVMLTQMKKFIVWMSAGFPGVAKFRGLVFSSKDVDEVMRVSEEFFIQFSEQDKDIDHSKSFMDGGHG